MKSDAIAPQVTDADARRAFEQTARAMALDPQDKWVGGYVAEEWQGIRHILSQHLDNLKGLSLLEFGCNYGASAIVTAHLGAHVTGVDIDAGNINLADANAAQYALEHDPVFLHVADTGNMPFPDAHFDVVLCSSVLEYVAEEKLEYVLQEIDRVLKPGGFLIISGTASRLAPKEVHSGRWLINYVPTWIDRKLGFKEPLQRGIKPWRLTRFAKKYINLDYQDHGKAWLSARKAMGQSAQKQLLLRALNKLSLLTGNSIGAFGTSFSAAYQKPFNRN